MMRDKTLSTLHPTSLLEALVAAFGAQAFQYHSKSTNVIALIADFLTPCTIRSDGIYVRHASGADALKSSTFELLRFFRQTDAPISLVPSSILSGSQLAAAPDGVVLSIRLVFPSSDSERLSLMQRAWTWLTPESYFADYARVKSVVRLGYFEALYVPLQPFVLSTRRSTISGETLIDTRPLSVDAALDTAPNKSLRCEQFELPATISSALSAKIPAHMRTDEGVTSCLREKTHETADQTQVIHTDNDGLDFKSRSAKLRPSAACYKKALAAAEAEAEASLAARATVSAPSGDVRQSHKEQEPALDLGEFFNKSDASKISSLYFPPLQSQKPKRKTVLTAKPRPDSLSLFGMPFDFDATNDCGLDANSMSTKPRQSAICSNETVARGASLTSATVPLASLPIPSASPIAVSLVANEAMPIPSSASKAPLTDGVKLKVCYFKKSDNGVEARWIVVPATENDTAESICLKVTLRCAIPTSDHSANKLWLRRVDHPERWLEQVLQPTTRPLVLLDIIKKSGYRNQYDLYKWFLFKDNESPPFLSGNSLTYTFLLNEKAYDKDKDKQQAESLRRLIARAAMSPTQAPDDAVYKSGDTDLESPGASSTRKVLSARRHSKKREEESIISRLRVRLPIVRHSLESIDLRAAGLGDTSQLVQETVLQCRREGRILKTMFAPYTDDCDFIFVPHDALLFPNRWHFSSFSPPFFPSKMKATTRL